MCAAITGGWCHLEGNVRSLMVSAIRADRTVLSVFLRDNSDLRRLETLVMDAILKESLFFLSSSLRHSLCLSKNLS